jgi:hypothetical protein
MSRPPKKKMPPARLPIDPDVMESPARSALRMLGLGYSPGYVALWLWHASRVEAGVPAPAEVPEPLR